MELVTPLGDVVMTKQLGSLGTGSHHFSINLNDVAAGVYMLFVYCDDEVRSERLRVG